MTWGIPVNMDQRGREEGKENEEAGENEWQHKGCCGVREVELAVAKSFSQCKRLSVKFP